MTHEPLLHNPYMLFTHMGQVISKQDFFVLDLEIMEY